MSNDRKNNHRPRRIAKSHLVDVEISDLTFDDVTKASNLQNDSGIQSASIPNLRSDSNDTTDNSKSTRASTPVTVKTDVLTPNREITPNLAGEHQFDFSRDPSSESLKTTGIISLSSGRMTGKENISSSVSLDSTGNASSLPSANGLTNALKIQSADGEAEVRLTGWKTGSVLGWSCFKGIVWGVIWMLLFILVSLAMDKMGILSTVNSLMGEAMHFDLGKMIELSVVAGVVLGVFVVLLNFFNMMFLNAYATLIGPLKSKATIVWKKNSIDVTVDSQKSSK